MAPVETVEIAPIEMSDLDDYRTARLTALKNEESAFGSSYSEELARPEAFWTARVELSTNGEGYVTYLARVDGEVVGLVTGLYPIKSDPAELVSMWVAPEVRRKGVGVRLIRSVSDWASAAGASELELWVMNDNEGARLLYEKSGFVAKLDHRADVNDPCREQLRMVLKLID